MKYFILSSILDLNLQLILTILDKNTSKGLSSEIPQFA